MTTLVLHQIIMALLQPNDSILSDVSHLCGGHNQLLNQQLLNPHRWVSLRQDFIIQAARRRPCIECWFVLNDVVEATACYMRWFTERQEIKRDSCHKSTCSLPDWLLTSCIQQVDLLYATARPKCTGKVHGNWTHTCRSARQVVPQRGTGRCASPG